MSDLQQLEPDELHALRTALTRLWRDQEPSPAHTRKIIYALARITKMSDADEYLLLWKPHDER